jgi:hypothetical protein
VAMARGAKLAAGFCPPVVHLPPGALRLPHRLKPQERPWAQATSTGHATAQWSTSGA